MENAAEDLQEEGGDNSLINEKEAELSEEKTHNNLKGADNMGDMTHLRPAGNQNHRVHAPGAINGGMEGATNNGENLQNGDRGGGGGAEGGGDLSSINAMMSAVMSAAGTINGGGDGGSEVASGHSSAGPSPR